MPSSETESKINVLIPKKKLKQVEEFIGLTGISQNKN